MHVTKPIDLELLGKELAAAGIQVRGLSKRGTDTDGEVWSYDVGGFPIDLPPESQPVVDAHVVAPIATTFAGVRSVNAVLRTTDAAPHEIFRFPTDPKRLYRATIRVTGIDSGNGNARDLEARIIFKRISTTVVQVGSTIVIHNVADGGAAIWTVTSGVVGTDCVISVSGAAGRTIDWLLAGEIGTYAPDGLGV